MLEIRKDKSGDICFCQYQNIVNTDSEEEFFKHLTFWGFSPLFEYWLDYRREGRHILLEDRGVTLTHVNWEGVQGAAIQYWKYKHLEHLIRGYYDYRTSCEVSLSEYLKYNHSWLYMEIQAYLFEEKLNGATEWNRFFLWLEKRIKTEFANDAGLDNKVSRAFLNLQYLQYCQSKATEELKNLLNVKE